MTTWGVSRNALRHFETSRRRLWTEERREARGEESEAYHWLLVSPTLALGQEQYQYQPG